jgi:archaellin
MSLRNNSNSEGFTGLEAAIVLTALITVAFVFAFVVLQTGFFTTQKSQMTVYKSVEQTSTNIQIIGTVYGIQSTGSKGIDEICFIIALTPGSPAVDLDTIKIVFSTPATLPVTLSRGTTANRSTFVVRDAGGNGIDIGSQTMELTLLMMTGKLVASPSSLSSITTTGKLVASPSPGSPTITTGKPVTSPSPVTTAVSPTVTVTQTDVPDDSSLHENQQVELAFNVEPLQPNTKMTVEIRPGTGAPVVFSRTVPATLDRVNLLLY